MQCGEGSLDGGAPLDACIPDGGARGPDAPAEIVAVEWFDGGDTALAADDKQWVNLPRDRRFVDRRFAHNIDRMSRRPWCRVVFDQPGTHAFELQLAPDRANVPYSPDERDRSRKFRYAHAPVRLATEADGTKTVDPRHIFVHARGGSRWRLKATDEHDNVVYSPWLESHRLIYYQLILPEGVRRPASLWAFRNEFARHNITLCGVDGARIGDFGNVGDDAERDALEDAARRAFRRGEAYARRPYALAVVFARSLAVKVPDNDFYADVRPDFGERADFQIRGTGIVDGDDAHRSRWLWAGIDDDDWWVSCTFTPHGFGLGDSPIPVPREHCVPIRDDGTEGTPARFVRVNLEGLPIVNGRLHLVVNWVDRFRGGLSATDSNLILLSATTGFGPKSDPEMCRVLVHEVGHKIGMVVDGEGDVPDKPGFWYEDSGHRGPHCHFPIEAIEEGGSYIGQGGNAECVMFGAIHDDIRFCDACRPAVQKVQFEAGWDVF